MDSKTQSIFTYLEMQVVLGFVMLAAFLIFMFWTFNTGMKELTGAHNPTCGEVE